MALALSQLTPISTSIVLVLFLVQLGFVSANPTSPLIILRSPNTHSRPAFILPLHHSAPNSSRCSPSNPHRYLQRSDRPNARMSLHDDLLLNGYYTTRLWIGTPPQRFALIVDTGSTVTYVPCSTCEHCGRHQVNCQNFR